MEVWFWDMVGPLLLILFAFNTYWSYRVLKDKKPLFVFLSGVINIGISAVFAWSIGPVILAVGVIQIFIGTMNGLKWISTQR